jgi:hypothetical protein
LLASKSYNQSEIAQIERQAAQAREMREDGYVIYIMLEQEIKVKGTISTEAYLDFQKYPFEELLNIIIRRIEQKRQSVK